MDQSSAAQAANESTASRGARNFAQVLCTKLLKTPLNEIAEAVGCDVSGASRIRANERPCTLNGWLKLMDVLGYKMVSKQKLCVPADELKMLRRAYGFISSSDELSSRFAASEEVVPLAWEDE